MIKQTVEEGGYKNRGRERRQLKVDAEEAGKRGEATRKRGEAEARMGEWCEPTFTTSKKGYCSLGLEEITVHPDLTL